jgi:hypothetical protein
VKLLPTPPLFNAPLVLIKQLHPVMQDIMDLLVIHLVKRVVPVSLQILEQVPGQQRVLLVPLVRIPYLRTLKRAPRAVLVPINTKMKWAKPVVNLASPVISPILVKLHVLDVLPVNTTAVECAKIAKVANIKTNRTKAVANPTVMSVTTLTAIKRLVYRVVRGNTKMKTTKQAVAKLIVPPVITLKTIKRRVCRVVRVNTKTKAIN